MQCRITGNLKSTSMPWVGLRPWQEMMDEEKLVIWGASGHARIVVDIAQLSGKFQVVGHIDDVNPNRTGESFAGSVVLGGQSELTKLRKEGVRTLALAVGDSAARLRISQIATKHDFELATLIHPAAVVARDVTIGPGTVIAAAAVINPGSTIGQAVIVNTSASVDHECVVADGAHIGPGAHLGGRVSIGVGTWIGIGAMVKDKLRVGDRTIIGAGSVVLSDIPNAVVAYGCPARVQRHIEGDQQS